MNQQGYFWALSAAVVVLSAATPVMAREAPLPPDQAFRMTYHRGWDGTLKLKWVMPKGYYLYRDYITAKDLNGQSVRIKTPDGLVKDDPTFGAVEVYVDTLRADIRHKGPVRLSYRGCQTDGLCYLPVQITLP